MIEDLFDLDFIEDINEDKELVKDIIEGKLDEIYYKIIYKPEFAILVCKCDIEKDLNFTLNFNFINHIIEYNSEAYYMHRFPLSFAKVLIPLWEILIDSYPYHYIYGDLMMDNSEYMNHYVLRHKKKVKDSKAFEKKKVKDYQPYIYNHRYNDETDDLLFVSTYKGNDIIFAVNCITGKISTLYEEKEHSYTPINLPKKYYPYLDIYLEFVHHKMLSNSHKLNNYDKYFELEKNWVLLKSDVKLWLSENRFIYPYYL